MTDTNKGWPGKPGVPLNPEKDDWHWLRTPDGKLVPYNWVPAFEVDLGIWPAKWVYDLNEHWPPEDGTYLGPCLTPDQAAALQARVAELEVAQARLILSFRLNILRLNPKLSHETISKAIDAALEGKKDEA